MRTIKTYYYDETYFWNNNKAVANLVIIGTISKESEKTRTRCHTWLDKKPKNKQEREK